MSRLTPMAAAACPRPARETPRASPRTPSRRAGAAHDQATLHDLRHAYRSFLGDSGIPEERADRYLGHSTGRASRIGRSYSHRIAGQLAADAATLEAYLQGEAASVTVLRPGGTLRTDWRAASQASSLSGR